jgi:hypothetical protein
VRVGDPFSRTLLGLLDGKRTREDVTRELLRTFDEGTPLVVRGDAVTSRGRAAEIVASRLDENIASLSRISLLRG